MIKIQKKKFNLEKEINQIKKYHNSVGAVSTFIGYVRNINDKKAVKLIELQVYKDMAFSELEKICVKAKKKWGLQDYLVIHRYGKLKIDEKILLVATFSLHRKNSYEACNYIVNYLKNNAPFWKKEYYRNNYRWLENSKLKN